MSHHRVTRVLGHPLHAVLTDFPVALLVAATAFDLGALVIGDSSLATVAHWCELTGLVSAVVAALAGFADLLRLESQSPAMTTALRHALFAVLTLSSYAIAFLLRTPGAIPSIAVVVLEAVGVLLVGVTGWFGGHLVFHHGVGVERGGSPEP